MKFMFDTNAFDKFLEMGISAVDLEKGVKKGFEFYITHIQTDELSKCPDKKTDKRQHLTLFLAICRPRLIPTESLILGHSRLGFAKLSDGKLYEQLLNASRNNVNDAIIGETTIKNGFILVTHDDQFRKKIFALGGNAISIKEFTELL